jgi:hypothetical protein
MRKYSFSFGGRNGATGEKSSFYTAKFGIQGFNITSLKC